MEDELDMETQLERELAAEQEELLEIDEDENEDDENDIDYYETDIPENLKNIEENEKMSDDDETGPRGPIESLRYKIRPDREHPNAPESAYEDSPGGLSVFVDSKETSNFQSERLEGPFMKILKVDEDSHAESRERPILAKVRSLPANFTYNPPAETLRQIEGELN